MHRVYKITRADQEIFVVDYSGLKESEMIEAATEMKDLVLAENKRALILTIFNDQTYVTPTFMRHAEKATAEAIHLVEKTAFVGLSPTKKIILRGYNFLFQRSFKAFDTQDQAIAYLLDGNASDKKYTGH